VRRYVSFKKGFSNIIIKKDKKAMWKKILGGLVVLVVLGAIFGDNDGTSSSSGLSTVKMDSDKQNFVGEWVAGQYFKVAVLGVTERKSAPVDFMCDAAPDGSRYVMVNIAVENVDSESRTLMDEGELHVRYEGKLIEYDQTESCTAGQDGFINFMEDIGPFVKKEGRVTFVIPDRFNATDMTYILPRSTGKVLLKQRPAESS